jgi:protein required for attachment to host cells
VDRSLQLRPDMNTLIIVADDSHARLYRIAKTADSEELIPIEPMGNAGAHSREQARAAPQDFAENIARHAARFALYHVCNPVVVAAPAGTSERLLAELERQLPEAYIRSLVRDMVGVEPAELLQVVRQFLKRPEPGTAPVASEL